MGAEDSTTDIFLVNAFLSAFGEISSGRNLEILRSRFGLLDGEPQTLEQVARRFELSRERVRQIVDRSLLRIRWRGISNRQTWPNCTNLITHLESEIRPHEDGHLERMVIFCEEQLSFMLANSQALPLISCLCYPSHDVSEILKLSRNLWRQRNRLSAAERKTSIRKHKLVKKFNHLVEQIYWMSKPVSEELLIPRSRVRDVKEGLGNSGIFFSDKLNRKVQYESSIEHRFYIQLEHAENVGWFQEQPIKLPYFSEGEKKIYYPDVFVCLASGHHFVVEVKPRFFMALKINLRKWTALKKYCKERGWGLLITDGSRSIREVSNYPVRDEFAADLLRALKTKSLSFIDYKQIANKHQASTNEFLALVLQFRLDWSLEPFCLSASTETRWSGSACVTDQQKHHKQL